MSEKSWQPIETAPKDGAYILLFGDGEACIGMWNGRAWDDGDFHNDLGDMSHWMPLPEPPDA